MKRRKNHSAEFKAKVALEAIREEMTSAELSKSEPANAIGPRERANGVRANQVRMDGKGRWIDNWHLAPQ